MASRGLDEECLRSFLDHHSFSDGGSEAGNEVGLLE